METLTFLFTDIEGSTSMLRRVGESTYGRVLAAHDEVIRSVLAAHDGRELNTLGDGFFAAFSSPRECIAAVLEMQRTLEAHSWPGGERVRVRMGVHTGEAAQTAAGVLGLEVHRAARIAAVANGGQILVSETAAALVRDALPEGAALKDLGYHRLKDLGRPEEIFQLQAPGLQSEFPPLHSLGNPALQNNLPVQAARFVGRDREVKQVRSLVETSRLVTLTGAGGSGKTRLSLQVAAELLDGSGDGVWLVELACVTDQEAVPAAISTALGIDTRPRMPVVEALVDALVPQSTLIVLDNCEHLIESCAKVADNILRHCPKVHLLATSREPLGIGGESLYRVPPMSLPALDDSDSTVPETSDAVALLVDRAAEQGVTIAVDERTRPILASICRRLDGMPLAIELAAARLRSLSLTELRDRLDQRFRLLTGGSRTAMARQQTLRATVDWSYALLTPTEQQLLRRLSVFSESFDLAAAEAVCGFGDIDRFEIADLLGSLVDKSLVLTEQSGTDIRYRLLETIRQFASERAVEVDELEVAAVAAAHCEHYLSIAESAAAYLTGPEQGIWFARLDMDAANLRRATAHAAGEADGTATVLRFGVALRRYWMARHGDDEIVNVLLPALDRPGADADPQLYVAAMITALISSRHEMPRAEVLGARAVETARALGDEHLLIEALAIRCGNYYFVGKPEKGLPYGREAVELARRHGDDVLLGGSLMGYLLCADVLDPERAGPLYDEAIACTQRSGDRMFGYLLHNNVGVHALRAGDLESARLHFEQAAQAMGEIGEKSHHVSVNLGWVLREEGDLDGARPLFETGLRMSRRDGARSGQSYSLMALACLAADAGEWQAAGELHGAAQAVRDRIDEPWEVPEADYRRDSLANIRLHLGAEQAELAFARGKGLGFDEACSLALGKGTLGPANTGGQPVD